LIIGKKKSKICKLIVLISKTNHFR